MRVALVGHACSPLRGSEPGVTWNWAAHLSAYHDITLFTHPQHRNDVEAELQRNPRPRLKVNWVTLEGFDPWNPRTERGIRWHYGMWLRKSMRVIRELHRQLPFDLVHHVSWAALQQPSRLWKLGLPFVWGPIGGGHTWPSRFLAYAGNGKNMERVRWAVVGLTPWNPRIVQTARYADLVLATNQETEDLLNRLGARRVEYFADYGVQEQWLSHGARVPGSAGELKMFWAGRCEPRKGLPLVLEAMAKLPEKINVTLTCAGEGPLRSQWESTARELKLDAKVNFLGLVPWERMSQLYLDHDVFVFPSLRDSQGTVILEAMARGLPLIALDHQGVARLLPNEAGIKVPVTEPQATIEALADAMRLLADNPDRRLEMGRAASACAAEQTWCKKVQQMNNWYAEVMSAHRNI